jgi:hypothetical protein
MHIGEAGIQVLYRPHHFQGPARTRKPARLKKSAEKCIPSLLSACQICRQKIEY